MKDPKALQANDLTIGDAEELHAAALRIRQQWDSEFTIWAYLMGQPYRQLRRFYDLYKIESKSAWDLAAVISQIDPGASHG